MHYKDAVGQELNLTVTYVNGPDSTVRANQYHARLQPLEGASQFPAAPDGYFGISAGSEVHKGQVMKVKVIDVLFMEGMNGGRTNRKTYASPEAYWADPQVKSAVMLYTYGGIAGRMAYNGSPDQVDMLVTIEMSNGQQKTLTTTIWEQRPPLIWYAEKWQGDDRFQFSGGFFEDAHEATAFFQDDESEDLFGDRRFPVIVFPAETVSVESAQETAGIAKGHSVPLLLNGSIIIGTRCKLCEYADVIFECYEKSGKVPKNLRWDWD